MTDQLTLREHLAVPYVLVLYSVQRDADWVRSGEAIPVPRPPLRSISGDDLASLKR